MAISTEKVYDMLPMITEIYDKLDIDTYRAGEAAKAQAKADADPTGETKADSTGLGIGLFKYVLTNSAEVKDEMFQIVSVFQGKTIDEVKAQSLGLTISALKEIFTDKEAVDLFKSAVQ